MRDPRELDFLDELVPTTLGPAFRKKRLTGSKSSGNAQDGGGSGNWNVFKTKSSSS
jgi:hypothetical protein